MRRYLPVMIVTLTLTMTISVSAVMAKSNAKENKTVPEYCEPFLSSYEKDSPLYRNALEKCLYGS